MAHTQAGHVHPKTITRHPLACVAVCLLHPPTTPTSTTATATATATMPRTKKDRRKKRTRAAGAGAGGTTAGDIPMWPGTEGAGAGSGAGAGGGAGSGAGSGAAGGASGGGSQRRVRARGGGDVGMPAAGPAHLEGLVFEDPYGDDIERYG